MRLDFQLNPSSLPDIDLDLLFPCTENNNASSTWAKHVVQVHVLQIYVGVGEGRRVVGSPGTGSGCLSVSENPVQVSPVSPSIIFLFVLRVFIQ
jgi:hypothetical protein